MPELTVVGVGGSKVDVSINTSIAASVAATLLNIITNKVQQGKLTAYAYDGTGPLGGPGDGSQAQSGGWHGQGHDDDRHGHGGKADHGDHDGQGGGWSPSSPTPGYLIVTGPGAVSLPASTEYVVNVATAPALLFGGTASIQGVVSDGPLTYVANTGAGTVVAGGGNSRLSTQAKGGGDHLFVVDGDNNVVQAFSGNDTVETVGGKNTVVLGSGNDLVVVQGGMDSIAAGSGNDTVDVVRGSALVLGGTGSLYFADAGGTASTVLGTTGAVTVDGGLGGGVYRGGSDGSNQLTGGLAATTLFGAGSNDDLTGVSTVSDLLVAGHGAETLFAAGSGNSTLQGGSGPDSMAALGAATLIGGSGGGTMTGGLGNTLFEFAANESAGHFTVTDFITGDLIKLAGLTGGQINKIVATQINAGGNTTITMGDAKVTFLDVSHLDRSSFT